mgnify:CR=1 FL=1
MFYFIWTQKIHFLFNDVDNNMRMIKTILDDIKISFEEKKEHNALRFYWKNILVTLTFMQGNIFNTFDSIPEYDIYFERAFRIMKEETSSDFESKIIDKLNQGGLIISDSGFKSIPLKKIEISANLSVYKEMVIGLKNYN